MRKNHTGTVIWFDKDKGYGYLANRAGEEVLVHYSDILSDGFKSLVPRQKVTHSESRDRHGLRARNVQPHGKKPVAGVAFKTPTVFTVAKVLLLLIILGALWYFL